MKVDKLFLIPIITHPILYYIDFHTAILDTSTGCKFHRKFCTAGKDLYRNISKTGNVISVFNRQQLSRVHHDREF